MPFGRQIGSSCVPRLPAHFSGRGARLASYAVPDLVPQPHRVMQEVVRVEQLYDLVVDGGRLLGIADGDDEAELLLQYLAGALRLRLDAVPEERIELQVPQALL